MKFSAQMERAASGAPAHVRRPHRRNRLFSPAALADIGGVDNIKIQVFSRAENQLFDEVINGEGLMRLFYGTPWGVQLTTRLFVYRWLSFFGGLYYDTPLSKKKIRSFAEELSIDVEECEKEIDEYRTFNEFFARGLKPGARPIDPDSASWLSPGDGRLLVFPTIDYDTLSNVKWAPVCLLQLFNHDASLVERFRGGACGILRLCPSDYHRFHFPATGVVGPTVEVPGLLHSVSPFVLEQKKQVFAVNKRTLATLQTEEFGEVLLMEVGAMGVGSIIQTATPNSRVSAGDEKGYFKYGGSTTIFFLQPGKVRFDEDIVKRSEEGVETLVRMGERIGAALTE